nr:hypothetical protein [Tanacetum cinerariifolium]
MCNRVFWIFLATWRTTNTMATPKKPNTGTSTTLDCTLNHLYGKGSSSNKELEPIGVGPVSASTCAQELISNIVKRHPPKEGIVPSDIDIIQESVAMVTTPADVIQSRDMRRVPRVRPYRQLRPNEQHVTTNTFNEDMTALNTCNNRRQTVEQWRTTNPKSTSCVVDTPYSPTTFKWAGSNNIQHGSKLPLNMKPIQEILSPVYMDIMEKKHSSACKRQQNLHSTTLPLANVDECARIIEKDVGNSIPQQVQLKERNVQFTHDGVQKPFSKVKTLANKHVSQHNTSITSNVYEQKTQSTKHLYAQHSKLSSRNRHITQKFASKSICGQQDKVQTNDKQKCILQKEYAERLDNNNAQVTSQVIVVPRIWRCDKSNGKIMYSETSNG